MARGDLTIGGPPLKVVAGVPYPPQNMKSELLMTGVLQGKTVIVTGAGGGIGRAASVVLAKAGANVVVSDVVEESGVATLQEIKAGAGTGMFVKADLSAEHEVSVLVDRAVAAYGRLDGAFNNAGLEQCALPLHELTTAQWERALRVDLTSVFWCIKYQVLAMMKSGGGAIVNTASSLGQVAIQNASEYIAAKHGVIGLTEKLKDRHPIGRFGEPSEIGEAVKWLLSDAASFMNGAAVACDGGYLSI